MPASEREKLEITGDYYLNVTGEPDKAARTYEAEIGSYPRASSSTYQFGQRIRGPKDSIKRLQSSYRQSIPRLAPDTPRRLRVSRQQPALPLQRFDEARQIIYEAQFLKMDDVILHNAEYAFAFLEPTLRRWRNSNSGLRASPKKTLDWRYPRPRLWRSSPQGTGLTKRAVDSAIRADSKKLGQYGRRMLL